MYNTEHLTLLKKVIAQLTAKKIYKTLNTLFKHNPNASKFDTRSLNEDIFKRTNNSRNVIDSYVM